jgi:hypothetical protein
MVGTRVVGSAGNKCDDSGGVGIDLLERRRVPDGVITMIEICRALEIRINSSADLEDKIVKACLLWYYKSLTYYIVVKNKEKECKWGRQHSI